MYPFANTSKFQAEFLQNIHLGRTTFLQNSENSSLAENKINSHMKNKNYTNNSNNSNDLKTVMIIECPEPGLSDSFPASQA